MSLVLKDATDSPHRALGLSNVASYKNLQTALVVSEEAEEEEKEEEDVRVHSVVCSWLIAIL